MEFGDVSVYNNLTEAFYHGRNLREKGITFIGGREEEEFLSYRDLYGDSLLMLWHLQNRGMRPGDEVVILVEEQEQYVRVLWACIIGGMVPVITPPGVTAEERFMLHQVCRLLRRPVIVTTAGMAANDQFFLYHCDDALMGKLNERILIYEELTEDRGVGEIYYAGPDETAIILFSSGSTGEPKGITHSHRTILHTFSVFSRRGAMEADDIFLCWTPLTHALGLNGWHILPTVLHVNHCLMRKDLFVNDPTSWFEEIHRRRATVVVSPNFGYKHFLKLFERERAGDWDLSCVRAMYNAAEPISAPLCEEFLMTLAPYGLRRTAMCPFYGMTETGLVISEQPAGREYSFVWINTKETAVGREIQQLVPGAEGGTPVVNVGQPVMDVRICDERQNPLPEAVIGHVQIQGINITPGYYANPEATRRVWTEDGWFQTGDVGFLLNGDLYVTGRAKDIIFVNGRNYFPHDIERVAREADGCADLQLAVCGVTDEREKGEVMLGYVVSDLPLDKFIPLAHALQRQVSRKMGLWLAHVLPVDNLPKTRSGKLQRYRLGEMYRQGEFADRIAAMKAFAAEYRDGMNTEERQDGMNTVKHQVGMNTAERQDGESNAERQDGMNTVKHQERMHTTEHQDGMNTVEHQDRMYSTEHRNGMNTVEEGDKVNTAEAWMTERAAVEARLLRIAADVLEAELDDGVKFFEICGDSLKMIQMVGRINREFGTAIKVTDLFKYNTVREIAEFLQTNGSAEKNSEEPAGKNNEETAEKNVEKTVGKNGGNATGTDVGDAAGKEEADGRKDTVARQQVACGKTVLVKEQAEAGEILRDTERNEGVSCRNAGSADIAVIGMAGRFPEADDLESFWTNLAAARCSVRPYPDTRREELRAVLGGIADGVFVEQGYLNRITYFEPEIFGIQPEEARYMDPQQRLLLELVEEAILHAGYHPRELAAGKVGVFLSANENDYGKHIDPSSMLAFVNRVTATPAARIAYVYDFHGPVMSLDSACSSSLTALHTACQYIRLGEIDCAVVGGAQVKLVPPTLKNTAVNPTLSPDFRARAFAKEANGTVDGEGGGILILKPLQKAVADRDVIHAVIKGSAVNSNGRRASSINAPNESGQAEAVRAAMENAGMGPLGISYIETHGTGTRIGDPIEVAALSEALTQLGYGPHSVLIGSLKSNIGHLIGVSGIANVIKTILSLRHKALPASIHFTDPNPLIDFANAPVYVNQRLREWKTKGPRRAGVTALGLTGTNVHVILEEAAEKEYDDFAREEPQLITLSARTESSLRRMIEELERYLSNHLELRILDIAYTLNTGRRLYEHRCTMIAGSAQDLLHRLRTGRYKIYHLNRTESAPIKLLLPKCEDIQWEAVDRLYEQNARFRHHWNLAVGSMDVHYPLTDLRVRYAVAGYAYLRLLDTYGIRPDTADGEGWGKKLAQGLVQGCSVSALLSLSADGKDEMGPGEAGLAEMLRTAADMGEAVLFFPVRETVWREWNDDTPVEARDSTMSRNGDEWFLNQLAEWMVHGLHLDWQAVYLGADCSRVSLPGYVFDRQSYFVPGRPFALALHEMEAVGLRAFVESDQGDGFDGGGGGSGRHGGAASKIPASEHEVCQDGRGAENGNRECGGRSNLSEDGTCIGNGKTNPLQEFICGCESAAGSSHNNQKSDNRMKMQHSRESGSREYNDTIPPFTAKEQRFATVTDRPHHNPESVSQRLREMMSQLLFGGKWQPEVQFFDTGVNSVSVIHLIGKLRQEFEVELNVVDFFQDITVDELFHNVRQWICTGMFGEEGIAKQAEQAYYPASAVQRRLFILSQFGTDTSYNVPVFLHGHGSLDKARWKAAFQQLIRRHEALRTTFAMVDGEVVQYIHPEGWAEDFCCQAPRSEWDARIAEFIRPFDLRRLPLVRIGLVEDGDDSLLMIDMHHIIFDGVSLEILLNEWDALYDGQSLPEQRLQYKDFAVWQQDFLQSETVKTQETYWLEQFGGEVPALHFPTDFPRPATRSTEGDTLIFSMDRGMTKHLREFAASQGVTLYMALLAALNVTLAKYSSQEDVVIGCPITGRRHGDMETIVGMFVNTLAMRNQPCFGKRYADFLREVKAHALQAYENQDAQFEELVDRLGIERDVSRNPLFDVMFVVQNANSFEKTLGNIRFSLYQFRNRAVKFDLTLHAYVVEGEIRFSLEYCTRLFTESTIRRFARHFVNIIADSMEHPSVPIAELNPLTPAERDELLYRFNETAAPYEKNRIITEWVEAQVERTPEKPAVYHNGRTVSYRQMNNAANALAYALREKGVLREEFVGIMVEPSAEMIVGVLGIVKSGAAYVPIDPQYPAERVRYMLEDSRVKLLLTQSWLLEQITFDGERMALDRWMEDETPESVFRPNPPRVNSPSDLVYIIYTSGSTGRPKGVMVEHRSLMNFVTWHNRYYAVTETDRSSKYAGFGFDASVWETYPYLVAGATIYMIDPAIRLDVMKLNAYFEEHGITITFLPTQFGEQFMEVGNRSLRCMQIGGDKLNSFFPQSYTLVNNYGPTENTVLSTVYPVTAPEANIPIGRPNANIRAYVLGPLNQLQPIGVPGELCLGGDNLARGYLNHPELTAEKFIENPHIPGERIYRTGDLVRWREDGQLEFLGRIDTQVKIRGFRVELGEIETLLRKVPEVRACAVVDQRNERGNVTLVAYLALRSRDSDTQPDPARLTGELRGRLAVSLPEYMIPSYFIVLDEIPLTANGKLDRRALPLPEGRESAAVGYVPPVTEDEHRLAAIWEEILGFGEIGIEDNFFAIGGHSLRATQMAARVRKEWNVDIPLLEIFKRRTIRELAEYLHGAEALQYAVIPRVKEAPYYPASSAQKRIYLVQEMEGVNTAYNMPYFLQLEGKWDRQRMRYALQTLVERHEAFRTSFAMIDEELVQVIHPAAEFAVEEREAGKASVAGVLESFVRPFDLRQAPLLRAGFLQCGAGVILMLDMHHIISDGISLAVFFNELFALYAGESLPELALQYKDFAAWQNDFLRSDALKEQEAYWLERLGGELPNRSLPADFPRPVERTFAGRIQHFSLGADWSGKVHQLANAEEATPYMVLLANLHLLLARYTGQEETLIGTPIAGRNHTDLEPVMGMFVNTLVMRNAPSGEKSFVDFLREVKNHALEAFANQDYQFEMLTEALHWERTANRNPLFDVMFIWQNQFHYTYADGERSAHPYPYEYDVTKFDLTLHAYELDDEIQFRLEYSTELFRPDTMERLTGHFLNLLRAVLTDPGRSLGQSEMLTPEEREQILHRFNDTEAEYPAERSLVQLFAEQVRRTPDQTALAFGTERWSYRGLNERANQLAHLLRQKGVGRETVVGIFMERSMELFLAVLAVVKAGGAYLPIDRDDPPHRMRYLLEDAQVRLLLTTEKAEGVDVEWLNPADPGIYQGETENPVDISGPHDLLYVLYTSGSTGEPKGVMVEHQQVNRLISNSNMLVIAPDERILQTGSIAFDASTFEIWGSWLNGAALCLIDKGDLLSPERLETICGEYGITLSWFTAPLFQHLWEENPAIFTGLRTVIIGGDALSPKHINALRRACPGLTVINGYGPTETVVFATYHVIEEEYPASIPIGRPVTNTRAYIVNPEGRLLPIGVEGELWIGGDAVARGYLHAPERTAEKFIPDPFRPGQRLYRSGDLARWRPDGTIEFIGRMDHQVKIRGFRVEPGEIEMRLLRHPAVKEACVLVPATERGEKYIAAFLTCTHPVQAAELRQFLAAQLPEHMLPSGFVILEKMPLTNNGKMDRRALLEWHQPPAEVGEYEAPSTDAERRMAGIWSEILQVDSVGVTDNFFEIGGHSLKAARLISRVRGEFGVEVPLKALFRARTIRGLLACMDQAAKGRLEPIPAVVEEAGNTPEPGAVRTYPVSSAQKRLFMVHQLSGKTVTYNMPQCFIIEGQLDRQRFRDALRRLIRRHESLRTGFAVNEGQVCQIVLPDAELELWRPEGLTQVTDGNREAILRAFVRPFDLTEAPLIRAGLIEMAPERHLLLLDTHHIIADGVSLHVLYQDLSRLYAGEELPACAVRYRDFAVWQNRRLASPALRPQEEFWLDTFRGEIPTLNLPTDYPRPAEKRFEGNSYPFRIGSETAERLRELSARQGGTLFMTLLACVNLLLHKYTGQEDIIIGSPVAGRQHPDLQELVGMFVNTLPMRNAPRASLSFAELLDAVRENVLQALENQEYQLEMLIDRLQLDRDLSRNPLFDVVFGVQNMEEAVWTIPELHFTAVSYPTYTAKFDLAMAATEMGTEIEFAIEYSTHLFTPETIQRMSRHLLRIMETVSADPTIRLADVELVSEAEKWRILYEFNDTSTGYPKEMTLAQLFEAQAARVPERTALIFGEEEMTYAKLNTRANQLAHRLREMGVKPDRIIALCVERSMEMIIGIMGILKAGGAYLPIDPTYPEARKEFMLADCEAEIILTQKELAGAWETGSFTGEILILDDPALCTGVAVNPLSVNQSSDLAYVMYTSGTTGQPKGSLIMHYNVSRLVMETDYVEVSEKDCLLQLSNYAFDGSTTDIYTALLHGAALVLVAREEAADLARVVERIHRHHVTVFFATTALFHLLVDLYLDDLVGVRAILFGGEQVSASHVETARARLGDGVLINGYGPTETTACAVAYRVAGECGGTVPIGRPLANNRIYILDPSGHLQPVGVPGEIYIGGDGVGRGYLHQPELTARRFVVHPLLDGGRLYRTGDRGRWLPDGNIEFLGRMDQQVKIRGYRIEPAEIENHLRTHEAVREAAVLVRDDAARGKYLAAYLECRTSVTAQNLRDYLTARIPEYMVPSAFLFLETMPLNANGKIDRKALPEPRLEAGEDHAAPAGLLEEAMARIWARVLRLDRIGRHDRFFDLGGHSLKATEAVAFMQKELEADVTVADLFRNPTIARLAEVVAERERTAFREIAAVREQAYYPLSFAQRRMWYLHQMHPDSAAYNMPDQILLQEAVTPEMIREVLEQLIRRHESFRTRFAMINGQVVQAIEDEVPLPFSYLDLSGLPAGERDSRCAAERRRDAGQPFRLDEAPILRFILIRLGEAEYVLYSNNHHIISDGWSTEIFKRELHQLLQARMKGESIQLPPLRVQYKDFAAWQETLFADTGRMKAAKAYWAGQLQADWEPLNLPRDYQQPLDEERSASYRFVIPPAVHQGLKQITGEYQTSLFTVLLAGFQFFLSRITQKENVLVGIPVAGRDHEDLKDIIGFFVNTTISSVRIHEEERFAELLERVKANVMQTLAYQTYPLELIAGELKIKYPPISVFFNMLNLFEAGGEVIEDFTSCHLREVPAVKFEIACYLREYSNGIEVYCSYCTAIFNAETIELMMTRYAELLREIAADPLQPLERYGQVRTRRRLL